MPSDFRIANYKRWYHGKALNPETKKKFDNNTNIHSGNLTVLSKNIQQLLSNEQQKKFLHIAAIGITAHYSRNKLLPDILNH